MCYNALMHKTLYHFDKLTDFGLKIIPLRESSKIPFSKNWTDWNRLDCRKILVNNPTCNIGLLLGDIIDVEGDTPEANETISKLVEDYPHPKYASSKSIHHLFANPDPKLTLLKDKNIEFRGARHQSVLPPSVVGNGVCYRWLGVINFPIPVMPPKLTQFFLDMRRRREENKSALKPEHMTIACNECRKDCYIHCKRFRLELIAFKDLGMRWTCHNCRTVDIRESCRKVRKQIIWNKAQTYQSS